jgi:hypothetical protein
MTSRRPEPSIERLRQGPAVRLLADHVAASPHFGAAVLVGSFARGDADAVSDVDLLLITYEGHFRSAWETRQQLHVNGSLVAWDEQREDLPEVGGHRWLTPDLVLFEALISAPFGGGRLAKPYRLLTGEESLLAAFPQRRPIDRSEMCSREAHPVGVAYDRLKVAVRESRGGPLSRREA